MQTLKIFREGPEKSAYGFSNALYGQNVTSLLTTLHEGYLHDKVKCGFSFALGMGLFLIKYEKMNFKDGRAEMHYKMALLTVQHLMERHWDEAVEYFKTHEPGDYCELLRRTIFKDMADEEEEERKVKENSDKTIEVELEQRRALPEQELPSQANVVMDFGCTLNYPQKKALVGFLNSHRINYQTITVEDIESFLSCKEGFFLRPRVNIKAVFVLSCLQANGYISERWQSIAAANKLFFSSKGKSYLSQHYLSTTNHTLQKKRYPDLDNTEKAIYDFINSLKDIKDEEVG